MTSVVGATSAVGTARWVLKRLVVGTSFCLLARNASIRWAAATTSSSLAELRVNFCCSEKSESVVGELPTVEAFDIESDGLELIRFESVEVSDNNDIFWWVWACSVLGASLSSEAASDWSRVWNGAALTFALSTIGGWWAVVVVGWLVPKPSSSDSPGSCLWVSSSLILARFDRASVSKRVFVSMRAC